MIIATQGLPASGKSYWANQLIQSNPNKYVKIELDELREKFGSKTKEEWLNVLKIREERIKQALLENKIVILSDTNLTYKAITDIRVIAKRHRSILKWVRFDTPIEICFERDNKRFKPFGEEVIMKLYKKALKVGLYDKDCFHLRNKQIA